MKQIDINPVRNVNEIASEAAASERGWNGRHAQIGTILKMKTVIIMDRQSTTLVICYP